MGKSFIQSLLQAAAELELKESIDSPCVSMTCQSVLGLYQRRGTVYMCYR